jgi:FixJ family two-component response regulator
MKQKKNSRKSKLNQNDKEKEQKMGKGYAWIDDEEALLDTVKLNFEMEDTPIDCYSDPTIAMYKIKHGEFANYKAVVTDMRMPLISGDEIIDALIKSAFTGKAYVASGHIKENDKQRLRKRGLVGFFDKPFLIDGVIETIRKDAP